MSDHYYSRNPKSKSEKKKIEGWIAGENIQFITDDGVFSKGDIDFGSRLLIETIIGTTNKNDVTNQRWLDLGCGYGAVGISVKKFIPNIQMSMVDINERALECARANVNLHHITNVNITQSDGFESVLDKRFDRIITNPPIRAGKQMIHSWYEQSYDLLNDSGELWLVIQKKQGAPSTFDKLKSIFAITEEIAREKGYYIFRAIK